ncbi:HNH endonuclease [Oceanospirillum sp. HFRX-1_2]
MARRSQRQNPETLRAELVAMLENFQHKLLDSNLRDQVKALIPANHHLRDLGSSLIQDDDINSARDRILAYLQKHTGELIAGDELMIVAGISEYARRIRELRVQYGWPVQSGLSLKDASEDEHTNTTDYKPDTYLLTENKQDKEAAYRWNLANEIRKRKVGVKIKLIDYFRANIGKKITGEELKYLANNASEWPRRVRELRTEEGWPIVTRATGRPDLPVGVYVLEEDRQAEVHDRKIPDIVRIKVLERDQFSCRCCNWNPETKNSADKYRSMLELHHIEHHANGGENTEENLITLCNLCHDEVHRGKISSEVLLKKIS